VGRLSYTAIASLDGAHGVHDLYAVFGSPGISLDTLTFSALGG